MDSTESNSTLVTRFTTIQIKPFLKKWHSTGCTLLSRCHPRVDQWWIQDFPRRECQPLGEEANIWFNKFLQKSRKIWSLGTPLDLQLGYCRGEGSGLLYTGVYTDGWSLHNSRSPVNKMTDNFPVSFGS